MLDALELTGRASTHVRAPDGIDALIHVEAIESFLAMTAAAAAEGIVLRPYSAYRDFDAQLSIWNAKYSGRRPLFDAEGRPRPYSGLSPDEIVDCILCWSALPGGSRHHWGTDIDVIDTAAVPEDYQVRLLPDEYASGGVFSRLNGWLDRNLDRFGFFRPYAESRGGINPEPWHISYAPVSVPALEALSLELLTEAIGDSDMMGKEIVLQKLDDIDRRYIRNISPPPVSTA